MIWTMKIADLSVIAKLLNIFKSINFLKINLQWFWLIKNYKEIHVKAQNKIHFADDSISASVDGNIFIK